MSTIPEATSRRDIEIRGVRYHVATFGSGEPLLLLHGGLGETGMFGPVLGMLAEHRTVIGVDLQGHGRSTLGDREIVPEDIADDLDTLLGKLGHARLDVLGYSFGGNIAFRLAVQHPDRVRRLVLVSAGYATDGFYPELRAQQGAVNASLAETLRETPMYQVYAEVAPHPEDFPQLLDRMGRWMASSFEWSEDVKRLRGPVLLVFGDSDMFQLEHVIAFYRLLGGGERDAGWMREHMSPNRLAKSCPT